MPCTHEQVVSAIKAQIEAHCVQGSNGVAFTPTVHRVLWFPVNWEPGAEDVVYIIHPGDETVRKQTSCVLEGKAEILIVLFYRRGSMSSTAASGEPEADAAICNEMVADVQQSLFKDTTFGGNAIGIEGMELFVDRTPIAELPSHINAGLRFVVRYQILPIGSQIPGR